MAAAALVPAAIAAAQTAPSAGRYAGTTSQDKKISLHVVRRSVQVVAFRFSCRRVAGITSLQAIPVRRRDGRYRFSIRAHAIVSYSDNRGDENGRVRISGIFSRTARSVRGELRVTTRRCGATGRVTWRARR